MVVEDAARTGTAWLDGVARETTRVAVRREAIARGERRRCAVSLR
jgi:hypothetical protein